MPRRGKTDWESTFKRYTQDKIDNPKLIIKDWCMANGVSYTQFSKKTAIERQKALEPKQFKILKEAVTKAAKEELTRDAREILKSAAPAVAERLVALTIEADSENVRLGASNSVLDRAGYAAEKMQVNVNTQINIPVLFYDVKSEDITQLRGEDA